MLKEKSARKEALAIVYREVDGRLKYYCAMPYLVERSFFQGITERGTTYFQIADVVALQEHNSSRQVTWHKIKYENKMIVLPGKRQPVNYKDLTEEEKHIIMRAIFSDRVAVVADYIMVQQGEK